MNGVIEMFSNPDFVAGLAWLSLLLGVAYVVVNVIIDIIARVVENRCKHAWASKTWCDKCWAMPECKKYNEKVGRFK